MLHIPHFAVGLSSTGLLFAFAFVWGLLGGGLGPSLGFWLGGLFMDFCWGLGYGIGFLLGRGRRLLRRLGNNLWKGLRRLYDHSFLGTPLGFGFGDLCGFGGVVLALWFFSFSSDSVGTAFTGIVLCIV